jgi:hypothetical protein
VPNSDIGAASFDDLIGACRESGRHINAEHLRDFEIDDELKSDRLMNRQIGRLDALEDLPRVNADLTIAVGAVLRAAANSPTGRPPNKVAITTDGKNVAPVAYTPKNWSRRSRIPRDAKTQMSAIK